MWSMWKKDFEIIPVLGSRAAVIDLLTDLSMQAYNRVASICFICIFPMFALFYLSVFLISDKSGLL